MRLGGGEAHPASRAATIAADTIFHRIAELGWGGGGLQRLQSGTLPPSGQSLGTCGPASLPVTPVLTGSEWLPVVRLWEKETCLKTEIWELGLGLGLSW